MPAPTPKTQVAVQLVGPNALRLSEDKVLPEPAPHEILARVEAVGLCFSDLKLLEGFDAHPRKGAVVAGLDPETLREVHSYVPDELPTVPGHEVVCRVVAIGSSVQHHRVGERCLVQTDYRDLATTTSNAAFGYNFEGGLQQYVLLDERVTMSRDGTRYLIPVAERHAASAIALVEPWACVEDAYLTRDRRGPKPGGRLLVVAAQPAERPDLDALLALAPPSAVERATEGEVPHVAGPAYDDIVYYGACPEIVEALGAKLAKGGLLNVVLGGERLGRHVALDVGRIHYGGVRWVGTSGSDARDGYERVPQSGELRPGERVLVVGGGGPMGQMHTIRAVAADVPDVSVVATDFDAERRRVLAEMVTPLARARNVGVAVVGADELLPDARFTYIVLMVPAAGLVQRAIEQAGPRAVINVFAGIPAGTLQAIDLDRYIEAGCYAIGTSGSVVEDMHVVLRKLDSGALDTNCSIVAVAGMRGAIAGMRAVQSRAVPGKIVVYPALVDLELTPLAELCARFPTLAAHMPAGRWTRAAEQELLRLARSDEAAPQEDPAPA